MTDEDAAASASAQEPGGVWGFLQRWGKLLLGVAGVIALVVLVREAGLDHVLSTLGHAAPWIAPIVLFDVAWFSSEAWAYRALLGPDRAKVPWAPFIRSTLLAYGVIILLPAGRVGAEVARGAALARYVGAARATAAGANLQAVSLIANTLITIPCWLAVAIAASPTCALAWLLFGNAVATGVVGTLLIIVSRSVRAGAFIARRFPRWAPKGAKVGEALRDSGSSLLVPISAALLGRVAQTFQYGVVLLAIGASLTFSGALVAQGIHLVGAGLGDLVPNQVGITEGAYRVFADTLGLASDPARAISIALLVRLCQFSLAATCLAVTALWKPK